MADRQRGVQIHRGIIYGSHARLLTPAERALAPDMHTHRWTIFLTSAASPPPQPGDLENMDYIPGGADDLSYMIKKVTFRLHETYPNPSRVIDKPPYQVSETGWGEFTVQLRIQFVQESGEKPMNLALPIKLHHWGAPIEGPTVPPSAPATAAPTPVASTSAEAPDANPEIREEKVDGKDQDGDVKMDGESTSKSTAPTGEATADGVDADGEGEADADADADADGEAEGEAEGEGTISAVRPTQPDNAPISVSAKLPVHAWQYDELIFADPPLAFYNILNEHPPTPLPARNRRARDQREEHTVKKKKGRMSTIASSVPNSRQGTPVGDGSIPPAGSVPPVGIPGEPGSADVPLEFSAEMEKAEWNKLHGAKRQIIEEMDRWRLRLIEEEKELQKLKDEMAAQASATPA